MHENVKTQLTRNRMILCTVERSAGQDLCSNKISTGIPTRIPWRRV